MKRFLNKIKNKIQNSGSGLILVIVALAFVGILAGALLTAVAYCYRLKLYDYNAKSNFYYLEQAMDELYAGVGTETMTAMQEAYEETREQVIYYDVNTKSYKNIGNEKANKLFKDSFMSKVSDLYYDNSNISLLTSGVHKGCIDPECDWFKAFEGLISNDTVHLVRSNTDDETFPHSEIYNMRVSLFDEDGKPYNGAANKILSKIIIRNVTLYRDVEYNRSSASGTFTQTLSTDIEIARPDFDVAFNSNNLDIDNLFSYCMIADSGVEINEDPGAKLTINGNIYAASDFYNKTYNRYDAVSENKITEDEFDVPSSSGFSGSDDISYKMNKVYNRNYGSDAATTLRNFNLYNDANKTSENSGTLYNGDNDHSKYSGLYIDGANVSILANYVIVPGSLSVMNAGDLTLYGRDGSSISESNVWVDELVLAGYVPKSKAVSTDTSYTVAKGANAYLDANLYVKDDTQIESDYAQLKLAGSYYGYSNSSTSDSRIFVPTTRKDGNNNYIYQQVTSNGAVENRGHYNSSSILINSKNATVDLSSLGTLYIAGRSYVELSHQKNGNLTDESYKDDTIDDGGTSGIFTDDDNTEYSVNRSKQSYAYDSYVEDYRTGESISIKSSQLAYIPDNEPRAVDADGNTVTSPKDDDPSTTVNEKNYDHYVCDIDTNLGSSYLFQKYFGKGNSAAVTSIPVVYTKDEVTSTDGSKSDKVMYFIDFDYVADNDLYDKKEYDNRVSTTSGETYKNSNNKYTKFYEKTNANKGKYGDYLKKCYIQDYFDYLNYAEYWGDNNLAPLPTHNELVSGNVGDGSAVYRTVYDVDTDILEDQDLTDLLNDVIHYEDYIAGQLTIPDLDENNVYSYTSGVITNTGNRLFDVDDDNKYTNPITGNKSQVSFDVITSKNSVIDSTLQGSTSKFKASNIDATVDNSTATYVNGIDFSNEYQTHYNYVKWALMDLDDESDEAGVVKDIVDKNGEGCITPINRYMNFDKISDSDSLMAFPAGTASATEINPNNLDLGSYQVWVSNGDEMLNIDCTGLSDNTITGIIISKGDVKFPTKAEFKILHPTWSDAKCEEAVCKNFNGIIITGGKIYVNNNVTNINATDLCKNVINACLTKASKTGTNEGTAEEIAEARRQGAKAIRVLSLFKAYQQEADAALAKAQEDINNYENEDIDEQPENEDSPLSISNIDYSDVIRYNNWMRNVD